MSSRPPKRLGDGVMGRFGRSPAPPTTTALLEVSPGAAKLLTGSAAPLRIQRVTAHTLTEPSEDAVAALRVLLGAQPLGVRRVGLLFGREMFSLRTLELPSTDAKEIASMLELQLGKLTPYPRADILYAWAVLGSFREGYTSVLLTIARKVLIEQVLAFLKTKGITAQWVGVSTEGLEAWWAVWGRQHPAIAPPQLTAVIDLDATSTDCAIFSGPQLLFTHSIAIGHTQLTSSDEAKLRWMGELVRLPRILLHEEVKGQIGQGLLTGLTEGLPSLKEQLESQWGVTVETAGALETVDPSAPARQVAVRVSYAALAGVLAMGRPPRLDLIPKETRVSEALQLRARHLARLAASVAAILILAAVLYIERILMTRSYLTQLQHRLEAIEPTSAQIRVQQHAMRQIRDWLNPAHSAQEVLRSVTAAADPEITLTQLTLEEDKPVTIRGKAASMAGAFAFLDRLKQQGIFAAVQARSVAKARGPDATGAEFEIVCEFSGS